MSLNFKQIVNLSASDEVRNALSSEDFRIGVRNEADGSVSMMIHGAIGDDWQGLNSSSLTGYIKSNKGKPINVDINSPGGLAFDGIAIYNAFAQHDAMVTMDVTGLCASAATIILMAADKRRIAENGTFMCHRAMGVGIGNHKVMDEVSEYLKQVDEQIAATYAARTGRKVETMLKLMDGSSDGTSMSGKQAVEEGFCDEVIPMKKKTKNEADIAGVFNDEARGRHRQMVEARLRAMTISE
jgi:ATP-dependent protease ClpP protease subunit